MALTESQRTVCRLLASNRIASGESYVAGGAALNEILKGSRLSRDIDLFHDTAEAVATSWEADRRLLTSSGYRVDVVRQMATFVEAEVSNSAGNVRMEWTQDSAFRFFPLEQHPEFGLTLHPFDLATNKVLALVGRLEVRDWVDVIACTGRLQPLGFLAWAACGKDPGFGPMAILEHAARSGRYSTAEVAQLSFSGEPPDASVLAREWHDMLDSAREIVSILPPEQAGACVLDASLHLFVGDPSQLRGAVARQSLQFHRGHIRGAYPRPTG